MDPRVKTGMTVRSGSGDRLGHVERVGADGIQIAGGPLAPWEDFIEVRDDAVFVATHRIDLAERREESPRS